MENVLLLKRRWKNRITQVNRFFSSFWQRSPKVIMVEPIFYSVLTRWKLNYEIVRSGSYKIIYDVLNVNSEICKRKLSSFVQIIRNIVSLELILGGSFRGCSRMGEKGQTDRICHTYPSMMKLGTVILYLKNIRKKLPSYLIVLDFNF